MKFGVATDVVYWHEKLVAISREISAESGRKTCTKVFVTFETETSQRECLKAMTTGETTPVRPSRKDTHCCVAGDAGVTPPLPRASSSAGRFLRW